MVTKYLKKKIAIALVAAMAIGGVTPTQIVPSFKMESVKAEETTPTAAATPAPIVDAKFDYETKMLKVGVKSSQTTTTPVTLGDSFYYQTVLYGNDGKPGALKANKWVAIEAAYNENDTTLAANYTNVDFSWLSCTKKQDLYVVKDATAAAAGTETPVKITINAQNVDLSIKYYGTLPTGTDEPGADYYVGNDVTGYLVSMPKATGKEKVKLTATQYKTENGEWTAVTSALSDELLKYVNKGVKLQFRVAPSSAAENVAGKTVTVSVPAKANGPKVTVDYNKQQITFPKGSEYILSTYYGKEGKKWTAAPLDGNKVKTLYFDDTEIGYNGTEAKTFYVRTAAKQNKVCSKITVVTIGAQVTVADDVVNVANGTGLLATKYDANDTTTKDKVFIQYKTPYDKSSGLLITNNSNKAYQVAVVKRTDITTDYYTVDANDNDNKNFIASKMIIGDRNSKIKFTDVKAYTVNKTTGVTKEGSATIATKDLFKTANDVTPGIADYAILYRQYDKSSKTNTAPAKTYMVDMAATLKQTLTVSDGVEGNPIESTNTSTNNDNAKELVGTTEILTLKCSLENEVSSTSTLKAKVYTKSDNTYNGNSNFKVTINNRDVKIQAKSAAKDGDYYVGVTLEGATTYYKINYVKAKLTLGNETVTLTAGTAGSATIALTTAGVADNKVVTTKWVTGLTSTDTATVNGITVEAGKIASDAGSVKVTIGDGCTPGTYYLAITVEGVKKVATITVAASTP